MKKTLVSLALGVTLLAVPAFAKYECTGIKNIVKQSSGPKPYSIRVWQDTDHDGKPDKIGLYVFNKCLRKLRESKIGEETESQQFVNDLEAYNKYLEYLRK